MLAVNTASVLRLCDYATTRAVRLAIRLQTASALRSGGAQTSAPTTHARYTSHVPKACAVFDVSVGRIANRVHHT